MIPPWGGLKDPATKRRRVVGGKTNTEIAELKKKHEKVIEVGKGPDTRVVGGITHAFLL